MIEVQYSKKLKEAAEKYLINCFEDKKLGSDAHPNVLASSLCILQGIGWFQDNQESNSKIDDFLNNLQIVNEDEDESENLKQHINDSQKKEKKKKKK